MSKQNKVNKGNYTQEGRLTPDDMAREREKIDREGHSREHATGQAPRGEQDAKRPRSAPAKAV